MSDQMHILVVEDDEPLNQGIVNSLRKDGYVVQGVRSGAEAIRIVWSEEYDVVIGDLKTPGADGFELLQWLRSYRPKTRMIMVTVGGSAQMRTQALEAGVVSYLEKPLDMHLLKEELRRLLQQTGFSASLASFDLLDLIQIITMSRKNIALLVNTGLEERGLLRFQGGELIWAEYGILRGEEAFFALAAYKNGTVIHQPWNEQIAANVTQPLSRLIFQALQYRAKYAKMQQPTGEHEAIRLPVAPVAALNAPGTQFIASEDDSPFIVLAEAEESAYMANGGYNQTGDGKSIHGNGANEGKEWWQPSEKMAALHAPNGKAVDSQMMPATYGQTPMNGSTPIPASVPKTPTGPRTDLPSWLTEQPTTSNIPVVPPSELSSTAKRPVASSSSKPPAEWQPPEPPQAKTTGQLPRKAATGPQKSLTKSSEMGNRRTGSPEWQPLEPLEPTQSTQPRQLAQPTSSGPLSSLPRTRRTSDALSLNGKQESGSLSSLATTGKMGTQRPQKRNYVALVTALQTLGYSIPGFVAAAVVSMDGQPIAQVAVDDLDISDMCRYFSNILQGVLLSLEQGKWGSYQDVVITSAERHILLRLIGLVGENKGAFQVLITSRESEPSESLEVMANVEGAIGAAL